MSARDVIARAMLDSLALSNSPTDKGHGNADAILSALTAAGYAVVPREPTEAMLQTFHDTIVIECRPNKREASVLNDIDVWAAMLAAGEATDDGR